MVDAATTYGHLRSKRQNSVRLQQPYLMLSLALQHHLQEQPYSFFKCRCCRVGIQYRYCLVFSRQNKSAPSCVSSKNEGCCLINRYCTGFSRWINYAPACNCRVSNLKSRVIRRLQITSLGILYHLVLVFFQYRFLYFDIRNNYD